MAENDPHDEIVRLEAQIEQLAAKLESCRKFILAGRVAAAAGGIALVALLFGVIAFDPGAMALAAAALLGGIVAWGSNGSTAKETTEHLATAESRRAEMIEQLDLQAVAEPRTPH